MIGSEAREALRGQRNHLLQKHQVLLQAGASENKFLKSQTQSEVQSHAVSYRTQRGALKSPAAN